MTENFSNNYVTALAADITSSDTTLTVSSATGAPAPNFRIIVDQELMLVTGVATNVFTVTRGIESTTAVAHTAAALSAGDNLIRFPVGAGTVAFTAISSYDSSYLPPNAADGTTAGNGWAKAGYAPGDWWRAEWADAQHISRIKLFGRTTGEAFGSGHIEFSDGGSNVAFGAVNNSASPVTVDFDTRYVTWIKVVSDSGGSGNTGLSEVEAYLSQTTIRHVLTAGALNQLINDNKALPLGMPYGTLERTYTFDSTIESWTVESGGTLSSTGARLRLVNNAGLKVALEPSSASDIADGEYQCDIKVVSGTDLDIVFRATDASNHYLIEIIEADSAGSGYRLYKRVSGTYTLVGSVVSPAHVNNDGPLYKVMVRFVGNQIDLYLNNSLVGSWSDTTYTTGRIGLTNGGVSSATAEIDNVQVYSITTESQGSPGSGPRF